MRVSSWQTMLALMLAGGVTRTACARVRSGPEAVWEALGTAAGRRALSGELGTGVGSVDWARYERQLERLERSDGAALSLWDDAYPESLREVTPPVPLLFYRGRPEVLRRRGVAMVGTRKPSPGGCARSTLVARELSERGVCVASGLARGIDTAAHRGALQGGAPGVAVIGTGLDVAYPVENAELATELSRSGCVVTEQLMGTHPVPGVFPMRNRIISGLSLAVVVVEGGLRSGALITAKWALEQGRDVGAVPGFPGDFRSAGPNQLLRQGAFVVETAEDIVRAVPRLDAAAQAPRLFDDGPTGQPVLDALTASPARVDDIAAATGLPVEQVLESLSRLEIDGRVQRDEGGRYARRDA